MEGAITQFGATHYNWRRDIRREVKHYERRFATRCNTYDDHPPGWHLDATSVDFWDIGGRGFPIAAEVGLRIVQHVRNRQLKRPWRWLIFRGRISYPSGLIQPYWDETDQHFDHVHVTYV